MSDSVNPVLVETTRRDRKGGEIVENLHRGAVAVAGPDGELIFALGDVGRRIFPRSAVKMIQAIPLVSSGAAEAYGLTSEHLALSCASHEGSHEHVRRVSAWLERLGLGESDLGCGPQDPSDKAEAERLRGTGEKPCRLHHNCSGKHGGFLTLTRHLKAAPADYLDPEAPTQRAVGAAFAEATGQDALPAHGVDGCAAPNFTASLAGVARAMAGFASAGDGDAHDAAQLRLRRAMKAHPFLIAGEGRACTRLTEALPEEAVVKVGADGVFTAILPGRGVGLALKIDDGANRAAESALAAILTALGATKGAEALTESLREPPIRNSRSEVVGAIRPAGSFSGSLSGLRRA